MFGEVEEIALGPAQHLSTQFTSRDGWWTLFFLRSRARAREDRILRGDPTKELYEVYQMERRRRFVWKVLDNGETHELLVRGHLGALDSKGRVREEPILIATYDIDDLNAHSDEFDGYYEFLAGLRAGRSYLASGFTAKDWEVTGAERGRWTRLLTQAGIHFYAGALDRLENLEPERFWPILARRLGFGPARFETLRRSMFSGPPRARVRSRRLSANRYSHRVILDASLVLRSLQRARREESEEKRLRHLVDAIYHANLRRDHTFDPIVMASLLEAINLEELIENEEIFLQARITKPFEDEMNLPERRQVVGQLGRRKDYVDIQYGFAPFDEIELYNMLDWVHETDPDWRPHEWELRDGAPKR